MNLKLFKRKADVSMTKNQINGETIEPFIFEGNFFLLSI